MSYTIPKDLNVRKGDGVLIMAAILLGVTSFGLGRLSTLDSMHASVSLCKSGAAIASVAAAPTNTPLAVAPTEPVVTPNGQGTIVASKNGSVYHFPWCSGAKRIKDENRVWFASKEEAEAAGYRPASNCKGLE